MMVGPIELLVAFAVYAATGVGRDPIVWTLVLGLWWPGMALGISSALWRSSTTRFDLATKSVPEREEVRP